MDLKFLLGEIMLNSSSSESFSDENQFLSDESDDSDVEDEDHEETLMHAMCFKSGRNCIKNFTEVTVNNYSEAEFGQHFRISRTLYKDLVKQFEKSETFQKNFAKKTYSAAVHITLFLWFASHEGVSFTDMHYRFDLSRGTVSYIITNVTYFISSLSPKIIRWPTDAEQQKTIEFMYSQTGMRGVLGAMDSTHIKIQPPRKIRDDYIDSKNIPSLCLQAICNEEKKFIDIFTGFPGSAHDSRVFESSTIYSKLPNLCGDNFILADSAYKCSRYVVTPYRDNGHLTRKQKKFNSQLSSGRVIIEQSFGILKQRFRQLNFCKLQGMQKLCHFIRACCVLHNLCGNEFIDMEKVNLFESYNNDADEKDYEKGSEFRDTIMNQMFNDQYLLI